jgi:hypothetical protein
MAAKRAGYVPAEEVVVQPKDTKVAWGVTSTAGYLVTALAPILSVLFAEWFSIPKEEAVVIAGQVLGVLAFAITQIGRYLQAKELAKPAPVIVAPAVQGGDPVVAAVPLAHVPPMQGPGPDRADLDKVEAELDRIQRDAP